MQSPRSSPRFFLRPYLPPVVAKAVGVVTIDKGVVRAAVVRHGAGLADRSGRLVKRRREIEVGQVIDAALLGGVGFM